MANFIFGEALRALLEGELDLNATDDVRVILCKVGNNAAAVRDTANFISDITLAEHAGAGYVRAVLTGEVVTEDGANNRAAFDAADAVFTALGADADATGCIVYKHVTNDADSVPLAFIDTGGFPQDGTGSDFTIQWNATGIINLDAQ